MAFVILAAPPEHEAWSESRACVTVRKGGRLRTGAEPKLISPEEARALVESGRDPVFLDTRNPKHRGQSEYQIPGSLRIWRLELEERIDEVPRGRPVVVYCA